MTASTWSLVLDGSDADRINSAFFPADQIRGGYRALGPRPASDTLLVELCDRSREALAAAFQSQPSESDWARLLQTGRDIAQLLHPDTLRSLTKVAVRNGVQSLSLAVSQRAIGIPWELMVVGERLLGEIFDLGSCYDVVLELELARAAERVSRHAPRRPLSLWCVAAPDLDGSVAEALALEKAFGHLDAMNVYRTTTHEDMRSVLAQADILHFCGHTVLHSTGHSWQLGASGLFTPELATHWASSDTPRWPWIVFANSCNPEPEERRPGATEPDLLAFALLGGGVRHYVGSLAPVPDHTATIDFAVRFYQHLLEGSTVGASLRLARSDAPSHSTKGRLVSAHYRHLGDPLGRIFEEEHQSETSPLTVVRYSRALADQKRDSKLALDQFREEASRLPHELGAYRVVQKIDDGPYRAMYLAKDTNSDEQVALAIPHDQRALATSTQAERYRNLAPKLDHPGLIGILDVDVADDWFYVAYQHAEGRTLASMLDKDPLPWDLQTALDLVESVARPLTAAHGNGVYHGDLSPAEIMVDESMNIRLLDVGRHAVLGTASIFQESSPAAAPYRPPELVFNPDYRNVEEADIWALAVIAYRLVTGHLPYPQPEQDNDEWSNSYTAPEEHRADLPKPIANFLERALASHRRDRYASASELMDGLRQARRGSAPVGGFEPDLESALGPSPICCVETEDEIDSLGRLRRVAVAVGCEFFVWTLTSGLGNGILEGMDNDYEGDPLGVIDWLMARRRATLLVVLDFDAFIDSSPLTLQSTEPFREAHGAGTDQRARSLHMTRNQLSDHEHTGLAYPNENVVERLRELARRSRSEPQLKLRLVALSRAFELPPELEKEVSLHEATAASTAEILSAVEEHGGLSERVADQFAWHAAGLGLARVGDCLRLCIARDGGLTPECLKDLAREKARIAANSNVISLIRDVPSFSDDVIGMDMLRHWVTTVVDALRDPIRSQAIPTPRSLLIGGMPGCGKSLAARSIAGELEWPLAQLDPGELLTGLLGGSEARLRRALQIASSLSPLVIWLDDIEDVFGTQLGAGSRMLQHLLTWLEERRDDAFLVVTARDPRKLPAELLRAGRFDMVFFVDWPTQSERVNLILHTLQRFNRAPDEVDADALARDMGRVSSAEVVNFVTGSLYRAADRGQRDPTTQDLMHAGAARPEEWDEHLNLQRMLWASMAAPAA